MTRALLRTHLDTGMLVRVRRGIYATSDACEEVRLAAAHGGALACSSAARHRHLWVLVESPELHVWMNGDGHAYPHRSCRCIGHWDQAATPGASEMPSVPRMLRQILLCHGVEEFFVVLESALRQGMLSAGGLAWLDAHTNAEAREALAFARADADSGLESLVRWRLRHHGLTVWTQVAVAAVGRVDLVIGDRLIVETGGKVNHEGPSLRHRDLVRDAHAAVWGYRTLRFDYAMVVHDWDLVERAILASLAD